MSFKDITLGRYVYGESILHRLDPRTKLICMLLVMIALLGGNGWVPFVLVGMYAVAASVLSGLHLSYILRSLLPFKWLILITFILNAVFVGGHIMIEFSPLPYGGISAEGFQAGVIFSVRIMILVMMASLLTLTTQPVVLVAGVEKLLGPFSRIGVKPHEVALAMVITIRFIPVLLDEAKKIQKSHVARGLRVGRGIVSKLRSISILLIPLFVTAVKRAEELAVAMECRLYRSSSERTRYKETHIVAGDWAALAVTAVFAIVVLAV
ncbi:energy-coupling factor transporter transmembrane component T family protein [Candidatus Latescibacterota bacterium]